MSILDNLYYYQHNTVNPAYNLALEDCLLEHIPNEDRGIFMLWQNKPTVVIGRHQNAYEEVHLPFLKSQNVDLVRRNTGGGAVYHDLGNLNFSFIVPNNSLDLNFQFFLEPIVKALNTLGINATLSGRNDLVVGEKKVSGSAQTRTKNALLHHGTLMVNVNFEQLEQALSGNPDKYLSKGIASVRSRVSNLSEFLPQDIDPLEVLIQALKESIAPYSLNPENKTYSPPVPILLKAQALAQNKYENPSWTLGKSPAFTFSHRIKFPFGAVKVGYHVEKGIIKNCTIEGDFFAVQDISALEKVFINAPYEKEAILALLKENDPHKFFLNAQNIDFTEVFTYNC